MSSLPLCTCAHTQAHTLANHSHSFSSEVYVEIVLHLKMGYLFLCYELFMYFLSVYTEVSDTF